MDLLLDTHVFLWYVDGNKELPEKIVKIINSTNYFWHHYLKNKEVVLRVKMRRTTSFIRS
ncbi:hypothetical protein [Mariniphaga sediminis]|uniref:hypothetical protein n=1 Tax=Mariniphaga sediminis TaxID=1628158 RepID=UPI003564DF16